MNILYANQAQCHTVFYIIQPNRLCIICVLRPGCKASGTVHPLCQHAYQRSAVQYKTGTLLLLFIVTWVRFIELASVRVSQLDYSPPRGRGGRKTQFCNDRTIIVFSQKLYNQNEQPDLVKEISEIQLIGKNSNWSTKTTIIEEFDMTLKGDWNIFFSHISSMTVEILGLRVSQIQSQETFRFCGELFPINDNSLLKINIHLNSSFVFLYSSFSRVNFQ